MKMNLESVETEVMVGRAQRFPLRLTMRYRLHGEETWRKAMVENISASGVLFHAEISADYGTRIDVSIDVPAARPDSAGARIMATGIIVRCSPANNGGTVGLAAALNGAHLLRR